VNDGEPAAAEPCPLVSSVQLRRSVRALTHRKHLLDSFAMSTSACCKIYEAHFRYSAGK